MPLAMGVGLGPGNIVFDGDPAPPSKKGHTMPLDWEVGFGSGDIVLDVAPIPLKKGHSIPTFQPMSIVAKRLPILATTELL